MKTYRFNFVRLAIYGLLISVNSQEVNDEDRIQHLEAEKSKLRKEMEAAIEDGLRALNKDGGGAAERYLTDLKVHMQQASGLQAVGLQAARQRAKGNSSTSGTQPPQNTAPGATSIANSTNATSLRRFDFKKKKKRGPDDLDEIFIYKDILEKKDMEPEKGKLMVDNRQKLEKKLFDWMVKRQEEKKRLKEYLEKKRAHLLEVVTEKCPNFGYGRKTTKRMTRRRESGDAVDEHRKLFKNRPKYPCCRKCCKKSYLGCL